MGENDHLSGAFREPSNLLSRRQGPMFVQTRDRVVNYDNFIGQLRILVERREEERQSQSIPITRAEGILKGRFPRGGVSSADGHWRVVDDYVVGASRAAPGVRVGYVVEPIACVEPRQVACTSGCVNLAVAASCNFAANSVR